MSTSTTNRGFPLSQYLCYADKILQDLSFDTKYVWDDEIHHAGRRGGVQLREYCLPQGWGRTNDYRVDGG